MNRGYNMYKIVIFLFVLVNLCSCMDDDFTSSANQAKGNLFTLKIPEMNTINIKSRSDNSNAIKNMLAVVIRNGIAESAYITNGFTFSGESNVSVTLTTLEVNSDEDLYVFCNVDAQSLSAVTDSIKLFQTVICTSGEDVMYGKREANAADNSIELKHCLSKVEVKTDDKYPVDSLLVCDVPKTGYAKYGNGYKTSGIEDVKFEYGTTKFFISRPDNNVSSDNSKPTTFILAKLRDKGWYRMDFYNSDENLENNTDYKSKLLEITPQTFYLFSIKSVKNNGYASKEEARKNPGSNIIYSLSVDKSSSASNGQYALMASTDKIMLYPGVNKSGTIDISGILQDNVKNEVTTYSAQILNRKGEAASIFMGLGKDATPKDTLISLMPDSGNKLTTDNSKRTIFFSCESAWVEDHYLEIRLGNIIKVIPFEILTANCYLMDCSKKHTIIIPFSQANLVPKEGEAQRIGKGDVDGVEVIWADQPYDHKLVITPKLDKGWFEISPGDIHNFAGNVIVGVKKGDTVLWSWHIWCMRNDEKNPIFFDDKRGIYDYVKGYEQTYSGSVWMDRNLGAYDLNKTKSSSRGLAYCQGRKDPFILTEHILGDIPLTPAKFPEATMYCDAGTFTLDDIHPRFKVAGYKGFPLGTADKEALEYTIEYPFSFTTAVVSGLSVYNWRPKYGNYWLTEKGDKSGYDPCPIGWRVPYVNDPLGPWSALSFTNRVLDSPDNEMYGGTWIIDGQEIFYPYVPYRMGLPGGTGYIGTDAVYTVQRIRSCRLVCADNFVPHVGFRFMNDPKLVGLDPSGERLPGVKYWLKNLGQAWPTRCVRDKSIN